MMKCGSLVINTALLPCKAYYFLSLAALASLMPYLPLYMQHIGLNASESAIIYGSMPFITFFVKPLWCMLADKFQKHKLLLILVSVFCAVFSSMCLLVPHVPAVKGPVRVYLLANNSNVTVSKCQWYKSNYETHIEEGYCLQSNEDDNYLHLVNICSLSCEKKDNDTGTIKLCIQRTAYCQDYENFDRLQMQNVSLHLIGENDTQSTLATPAKKCHQYLVDSFEVNSSEFDRIQVKHPLAMECNLACKENTSQERQNVNNRGLTFGLFFLLYLLSQIFQSVTLPLADAMSLSILTEKHRTSWGRTRVFGTLGYALFAVISGLFMDSFTQQKSVSNFYAAFILSGSLSIVSAVSGYFIDIPKDIQCARMMKNLSLLFKDAEICIFLIIIFIFGVFMGVLQTFLFWYLGELCSPKVLMGLTLVVECVSESPMLYFSGWIINKIGHRPILFITLGVYALRFGAYSFLTNPWYVFLIEPTHAITYGLLFAAATEYTDIIAPPGMSATLQGLVGGLHWSLGFGIGSLTAGQIYNKYGGVIMFRSFAISAIVVLLIAWPLEHFVLRARKKFVVEPQKHTEKEDPTQVQQGTNADEKNTVNSVDQVSDDQVNIMVDKHHPSS
ncbi:major facilitator superfamily domain-containing protein 6-A [Lingula anatina]|uniref:Major facilitator superfamily domain-containing protein 6-A n=1 Tax=Lingula anatina TaxID=7574 RepID=A0A1S3K1T7_LINAN|nr:major facilitator superfamily domain-containing protein 6-A [Lingula anatina]XP_013416365.1 major facilitator superfamily domain-containing protein 6-A [Lingula anatina]|eukprot:XP_013416364.1 major facilitator superfamily domain-containing protein 6-A [Lingula anatina]